MTKICTDIEQSKKLLELGVDVNTADMRYSPLNTKIPWVWVGKPLIEKDAIPAWSLAALLELIGNYELGKPFDYDKFIITWYGKNESWTIKSNSKINAAFEMICWLKENGKI